MRTKFKKLTSVCLAFIMIMSVLTVAPFTAGAAETDSASVGDYYTDGDFSYYGFDDGTASIRFYFGSATELEIPSTLDGYTVTEIGEGAFAGFTRLKSITIPDSVTEIGSGAFSRCESLVSITIPDSVTEIGYGTFEDCKSLASVTIPDSVTEIGERTFQYCTSLASVAIPDSVIKIGCRAFADTNITNITIPDSVAEIGWNAFAYTKWYDNQPDGVVYAGKVAYDYKGEVPENTSLIIKEGTKGIADHAFQYCGNITTVTIPYSVTEIGDYAFDYCTSLASVAIPDSVIKIGFRAFAGTNITNITIPDSVAEIGNSAFSSCTSLVSITIPESVTEIGEFAFDGCTSLASITIPDSVTQIGEFAFSDCTSLASITIPDSVTEIGDYAFDGCTSLASIIIPDGVTKIGRYAFYGCTSLASITIPDSVTKIGNYAFIDTAWYNNQPDGVVYAGKVAYDYKGEVPENTSLIIKEGTKGIADHAFQYCGNITTVTIPNSVTEIGEFAFSDCTSLASITIPDGVTEISYLVFDGCTNLTSIIIPKSVIEISKNSFGYYYDCYQGYVKYDDFIIYGYTGTVAETYAKENGFDFVPINEYIDVYTKISVSVGTDAELKVAEITDINEIEQVNLKLENEKVESLYDISFVKDGTTVQPVGTATVKIPCTNENSKVYRAETDGSLTDMNAVYDNDYMVFSTNHFSIYVLTSEKSDALLGDVDGDGKVSIDDATDIQKHLANMVDFTKEQVSLADIDMDEEVTINDVTLIQKHLAGMATIYNYQ